MRCWKPAVIVVLWLAGQAAAQVAVEVVLDRDQFLAGEPLLIGVRVTNFSGQTLRLGAEPDWLRLNVEGDRGFVVEKLGDPPVLEEFEVPSASKGTRWIDLEPYFNVSKPGSYQITATVRIPELGSELGSKPKRVMVTSGAKIWEQEFGLPGKAGIPGSELEVRRYALIQSMDQKQSRLYVRVSNRSETKIFRVFPIGPVLAFSHPEPQVDRNAFLHVLFQTGARFFTYVCVDCDGKLVAQQTHQYTDTRPRLRAGQDGTIYVSGGVRIKNSSDFPRPDTGGSAPPARPTTDETSPKN